MMYQRCLIGIIHMYSYDYRLNVVSLRIQASVIQIFKRASGEYRTHCKFGLHSSYEQHRIYVSFSCVYHEMSMITDLHSLYKLLSN